jgi:Flp pilus assembly protein TadG
MRRTSCSGQALAEFAVVLPLLLLLMLGVVELGYALLDQHVVTKLTREGSNLTSRGTSLADAATALTMMSSRPVDFNSRSELILSVLRKVATQGAANYDKVIVYQRYQYGHLAASSALATRGAGSFGDSPDFQAANSDNDTNLQVTNLPPGLLMGRGGLMYVTEIFTTHDLLTPLDRLGVGVPGRLYAIAYF